MHKVRVLLRNPLIIVPPFVIVMGLGWQQYTYAGRQLSMADSSNVFPDGLFAQYDGSGLPTGWGQKQDGSAQLHIMKRSGYVAGHALEFSLSNYHSGSVTITTPTMPVRPGTSYLFKGYYSATNTFQLLMRYPAAAGQQAAWQPCAAYPATQGSWSTASCAFVPPDTISQIQFAYRLYTNTTVELNGLYLQPRQDIYLPPKPSSPNLIPNADFAQEDFSAPTSWSTYQTGQNDARFAYLDDTAGRYLQVTLAGYHDGQARWQYAAQPTGGNQYLQLGLQYTSTVPASIVAEYVLQDGSRQYQTIGPLMPASSWTAATYRFETPAGARTVFVSVPLKANGTISTRAYSLQNITVPGAGTWKQPLVSISFDDGWQSSYQNAVPLLRQHSYAATFYINPATIETTEFMSAHELAQLQTSGNEIGAHSFEHRDLTAISPSAVDYQLHESRDYLARAGYTVSNAATPYGRSDAEVQWYARRYFATLRGTESGINTRQNIDPYNLLVYYVTDQTTDSDIAIALNQTKAATGWLILVYHRITNTNASAPPHLAVETSSTTISSFTQQLAEVQRSGIRVLPVQSAYIILEQQ